MTAEIESGIAQAKPKRARKPKAAARTQVNEGVLKLLDALEFILPAQKKTGTPTQQHCIIRNGWIAATNEILTIAARLPDAELQAVPHTHTFIEALKQCEGDFAIVQISDAALSVRSGDFSGLVGCVRPQAIVIPGPDVPIAPAGDAIKAALGAVAVLATDGAPDAILASVMLQSNTCAATNYAAIAEYWHGISLPPGLLLPRASAIAISKVQKPLLSFGYSESSATFHFEDGSWIKTQLYKTAFPHYAPLLDIETNALPLPVNFWHAAEVIAKFSAKKQIYFEDGAVSAREFTTEATTFKIEGLPHGIAFNVEYILALRHMIDRAEFRIENQTMYFFGPNARGALRALTPPATMDDDIPF